MNEIKCSERYTKWHKEHMMSSLSEVVTATLQLVPKTLQPTQFTHVTYYCNARATCGDAAFYSGGKCDCSQDGSAVYRKCRDPMTEPKKLDSATSE